MQLIEVVYENGVFRPLQPVELPEGARAQVSVVDMEQVALQSSPTGAGQTSQQTRVAEPLVGKELAALLDQIAGLPYTPHPDGRTDISSHHEDNLYPKDGQRP